ncbi:MAG: glycoside hydrolase family 10 protein [Candidatus Sumerlaeaceae bacterium]
MLTLRAAVAALLACFCTGVFAAPTEYRALWVDVFHKGLRTRAEADDMLATARAANYNAIVIQVRKACDAYYDSGVEPKNPAVEPGFNPLEYIIQRAHSTAGKQRRIEVHAWLVAYRTRLPNDDLWKSPNHIFQQHPEWLGMRADGSREDKGENPGRYYLDPGIPQVIDYNLSVVRDILSRYDIDGIHYDYIRYPEGKGDGNPWGYNPVSLARFNAQYARTGKPAADDPQFSEFRRQQIYDQVRKVYAHVRAWRPRVKVSVAAITWGDVDKGFERSSAYTNIMQDWPQMAQDGFLDVIFPMNYKREKVSAQARSHRTWARFLGEVAERSGRFGVNGVDGEELNSVDGILAQIRDTRSLPGIDGIITYCYAQPRAGSGRRPTPDIEFFNTIRQQAFPDVIDVPDAMWLSRPSEGLVKGIVTRGGMPADGAVVRMGGRSARTDGTGFYAFARVPAGQVQVRAEDAQGIIGGRSAQVQPGAVAEAPIGG